MHLLHKGKYLNAQFEQESNLILTKIDISYFSFLIAKVSGNIKEFLLFGIELHN